MVDAGASLTPLVQAKLRIGPPNDRFEEEADRMANAVMRMPSPANDSPSALEASSPPGLQRKCAACSNGAGPCPECREEQENVRRQPVEGTVPQDKLSINMPGDRFELEADHVADQVLRMPNADPRVANFARGGSEELHRPASLVRLRLGPDSGHRFGPEVQRRMSEGEEGEDEKIVQTKARADRRDVSDHVASGVRSVLQSGGRPMAISEAAFFESRFGRSFDDVRIHTGARADAWTRSINARAFTVGSDIAFANGEYGQGSPQSRRLLAHELTHTIQQTGGAEVIQRGSAGILGGTCCNSAPRVEWALVGDGVWKKLERGECTGTTEDCDGMTCGGGFYHVDNLQTGTCSTPRNDDATFASRRWTPSSSGSGARSPTQEGSTQGDKPPNWEYDSAATSACPAGVRTVTVDSVRLHGSTLSPATEIANANTVYAGCCVRFQAGATPPKESQATTESWLGGDTDVDRTQGVGCGNVGGEEQNMFDRANAKYGFSSRMRVFYVASFSGGGGAGYSIPPYCATGPESPYVNYVVLSNSASSSTNPLAHEFGHILLDSGNHETPPSLMAPAGGTDLTPTQCVTVYGNA